MKATAPEPGLSFAWFDRERFPWFLFICVVLSFAAHAGSFLIFQVIYPQRATLPPPPPQVQLLSSDLPEFPAIWQRVQADDPSLVASTFSATPVTLFDVPYRPSFTTLRTAPRSVPEEVAAPVQFPAVKNPLAIIRSAEATPSAPTPAPIALSTRVTFSPTLAGRPLQHAPTFAPETTGTAPVEPSRFLIGVTDRGEVRFVFLQQSSGNPALDAEASRALTATTFAQEKNPVTWSHATIQWGDEVFAAGPKSAAQPPK